MEQINIHTAKTQLSKLISEGREVIIARYGRPVARLLPIKPLLEDRVPGTAKEKIKMSDSFLTFCRRMFLTNFINNVRPEKDLILFFWMPDRSPA